MGAGRSPRAAPSVPPRDRAVLHWQGLLSINSGGRESLAEPRAAGEDLLRLRALLARLRLLHQHREEEEEEGACASV